MTLRTNTSRTDDHPLEGISACLAVLIHGSSEMSMFSVRQDPRSPRKSAMDLVKAAVVSLSPLASLGIKEWDYEHKCRVVIQRNAITRSRPAIHAGWQATFIMMVTLPEYITREVLHALVSDAGRLIGVCDFRPTYGRFQVIGFDILEN